MAKRPDAGMDAEPHGLSSFVRVDITIELPGSSEASGGDDGDVAVDMDLHLVDVDRWDWLALQVSDIPVHCPDIAGRSIEVGKARGQDRLEELPRALTERIDKPLVERRQDLDIVDEHSWTLSCRAAAHDLATWKRLRRPQVGRRDSPPRTPPLGEFGKGFGRSDELWWQGSTKAHLVGRRRIGLAESKG